jgi:formylglycine-generating enzyme required for sulfatase activity
MRVFISYSHADLKQVSLVAEKLEQLGIDVWMDRSLKDGDNIISTISEALSTPRWVLVFWSRSSIHSEYVHSEAEIGRRNGVLVPVHLDNVAVPPPPFTMIKGRYLLNWNGDASNLDFSAMLERVRAAPIFINQEKSRAHPPVTDRRGPIPPIGTVFRDHPNSPEMVVVPEGEFLLGSPENEPGHDASESPMRNIRIGEPIAVGRFPVRFLDWSALVADGGSSYTPPDEGWGEADRPVINVSWHDANQYVEWLRRLTGLDYRLLSESEWEYCCRAGTRSAFAFGPRIGPHQANYDAGIADRCNERVSSAIDCTTRVGTYAPNDFGIYDLHGNVREWTSDAWSENHIARPENGAPLAALNSADLRTVRGGCWNDQARDVRSARRSGQRASFRSPFVGFRVARSF